MNLIRALRACQIACAVALHPRCFPPHGSIAVLGRRPATGAVARPRGWCDDDDSGGHREREPPVVMYTAPHPASTSINGMGSDMIDGSGTINPAALNTPGNYSPPSPSLDHIGVVNARWGCPGTWSHSTHRHRNVPGDDPAITTLWLTLVRDRLVSVIPPSSTTAAKSSPRGLKRSRSPEDSEDSPFGEADDGR